MVNTAFLLLFYSCNEIKNECCYQYTTPPISVEQKIDNYTVSMAYLGSQLEAQPGGQSLSGPYKNAEAIMLGNKFCQTKDLYK